jgi:hypothetical protein
LVLTRWGDKDERDHGDSPVPDKYQGMWALDDEAKGLNKELFVSGTDTVIDRMVQTIPCIANGFTLVFSSNPFPGHQA